MLIIIIIYELTDYLFKNSNFQQNFFNILLKNVITTIHGFFY